MKHLKYKLNKNMDISFIDKFMEKGLDIHPIEVAFDNNEVVKMQGEHFIFNVLCWQPYFRLNLPIWKLDIFEINEFTSDTLGHIRTVVYRRLIQEYPDKLQKDLLPYIWQLTQDMYDFAKEHLRQYCPSLDILSIVKLRKTKKVKAILDKPFSVSEGSDVVEKEIELRNKSLINLLKTPNEVEENSLLPFLQADVLNSNQFPQLMIAYGPRSDLDDSMKDKPIESSAISGLNTGREYGVESLATKKASYYSKTVIKQSQYFGRMKKLASTKLSKVYPGDCGARGTLAIFIRKGKEHNFYNKVIVEEGVEKVLTSKNIDKYVNTKVNIISPLRCRYKQGICQRCAGVATEYYDRHTNTTKHIFDFLMFIPDGIHIGLLASSIIASIISQKVLSAKHLIKTVSIIYKLNGVAEKYFTKRKKQIFLTLNEKTLNNLSFRIPVNQMRTITDLTHKHVSARSFSSLHEIKIIRNGNTVIDVIDFDNDNNSKLYLSMDFLQHMQVNYKHLQVKGDYIDIPLRGFNTKNAIIITMEYTDDMLAFTSKVSHMLRSTIGTYSDMELLLNDFVQLLYSKTSIEIVYVEILLKIYLSHYENDDYRNVKFSKLTSAVSDRSISTKLAFQDLAAYFNNIDPSVHVKEPGLYDALIGFTK